jgi:uncharacterized protein (DUF885 family)
MSLKSARPFELDRRQFLAASAVAGTAALLGPFAQYAIAAQSPDAQLTALLDAFLDEDLVERPQAAPVWGLDQGPHAALRARLNDYSAAGRLRVVEASRSRLERLRQKLTHSP